MRRVKPISVGVRSPSRGLVTRLPTESADLLSQQSQLSQLQSLQRSAVAASNVRYEDGVVAAAPGYERIEVTSSLLSGLVAHWRLDEPSSTRLDATLNNRNLLDTPGTASDVSQVPGMFSKAAFFPAVPFTPPTGPAFRVLKLDEVTNVLPAYPDNINALQYLDGSYYVVGGGPDFGGYVVFQSADALSWTQISTPLSSQQITNIVWTGTSFIATGVGGKVFTSPDAVTWTQQFGTLFTIPINSTAVGAGVTVCVATPILDPYNIQTSGDDGVSWTGTLTTSNAFFRRVIFGGGLFVAAGNNGTISTSPDGLVWSDQSSGISNSITALAYGGGVYLAVSTAGDILTSPDGAAWTIVGGGPTDSFQGAAYGDGQFIIVSAPVNDVVAYSSPTGAVWAPATLESAPTNGNQFDIQFDTLSTFLVRIQH